VLPPVADTPRTEDVNGLPAQSGRLIFDGKATKEASPNWRGWRRQLASPHSITSTAEKRRWNGEAKRLGRLEVDDQLVPGRRLHWQIRRSFALENAVNVTGSAPVRNIFINAVRVPEWAATVNVSRARHRFASCIHRETFATIASSQPQ
jgi:hypothetical protein